MQRMSGSAQVGHFVGFQVALKVFKSDPSFLHRFSCLVGFDPLEPAVLSQGSSALCRPLGSLWPR
eukprot:4582633-Amphidinium_carterae.1